jgi:hypothetical protein
MSDTSTVSPLRQRVIEDMAARKLDPHTQRGHIYSCKRLAAWLKRSPDTAPRRGAPISAVPDRERDEHLQPQSDHDRVRLLFRVALRRRDLAAEVRHIKEPERLPPVLSPQDVKRVLTMATSLKARAMLTLAYGCGLRAAVVVRLRAGHSRSTGTKRERIEARSLRHCASGSVSCAWTDVIDGRSNRSGEPLRGHFKRILANGACPASYLRRFSRANPSKNALSAWFPANSAAA